MRRNLSIIVVLAVVPHPLWKTCSPVFGMDPPPAWVFTNLGAMDPDPGDRITRPYAINDAGEIVGASLVFVEPRPSPDKSIPFHWVFGSNHGSATTPHNPEMLDLLQSTNLEGTAYAINNTGKVVGYTWPLDAQFGEKASDWLGGTTTVLSGLQSWAYAINDNGRIFGKVSSGAGILPAEIFLSSGPTVLLGPPEWFDTGSSPARGVNSLDQVVGTANHALYGESAFFWDQGQAISLQPSAGSSQASWAFDINDFAGGFAPIIWTGPTPMYDGYEIIDSSYQFDTPYVNAINNNRWIVGKKGTGAVLWYKNQSGFWRGVWSR